MKKTLAFSLLMLAAVPVAFSGTYQITYQKQHSSAEKYSAIDVILDETHLLQGFLFCSETDSTVIWHDIAGDTSMTLSIDGRPYQTVNTFDEGLGAHLVYLLHSSPGGWFVSLRAISDQFAVLVSDSVELNLFRAYSYGTPLHKVLSFLDAEGHVRFSGVWVFGAYYGPNDYLETYRSTTVIFDPWLGMALREPKSFVASAKIGGSDSFVGLTNNYFLNVIPDFDDPWGGYVWDETQSGCIDLFDRYSYLFFDSCNGDYWFRRAFTGDFFQQATGDEIIVQYWPAADSPDYGSSRYFTDCLSFGAEGISILWERPYEYLDLSHLFRDQHYIAGMRGKDKMIALNYRTGQLVDSVNLDRELETIRFFETASGLNLVGRSYDTIFVYQFATPTTLEDQIDSPLPERYNLAQNYPNPFNPSTTIEFELPHRSRVSLTVYNILGQKLTTILDEDLPAGTHAATWDGSKAASSIYLYRLVTEDYSETRKMILLK
jgi:hypothetical protein